MVRIFWSAVAILVAVTAAVFFLPSGGSAPNAETRTVAQNRPERSATERSDAAVPQPEPQPEPDSIDAGDSPDAASVAAKPDAGSSVGGGFSPDAIAEDGDPVAGGARAEQAAPDQQLDAPRPAEVVVPTNMPRPEQENGNAGPGEPVEAPVTPIDEPADDAPPAAEEDKPAPEDSKPEPDPATTDNAPADENASADNASADGPADAPAPEPTPTQEPVSESESTDDEPSASASDAPAPEAPSPIAETSDANPPASLPANPASGPSEPAIAVTPRAQPDTTEPSAKPASPVVKTPTGLLLNGRWEVEGKGTKGEPYAIDWDMLVAVQREYQPRLGKTAVPEWIKELDGKVVTIRGYALLPMGMSSMSELLVMLNQWDSCCIGVPPTPYDAIEVRLEKDLSPQAQSMFSHTGALSFGDITGTFKVDPYIVQGYLLGLYLMEDASANLLGPAGTP